MDLRGGMLAPQATWKEEGDQKHWYRYGHYTLIEGTKYPLSVEEQKGSSRKVVLIEYIRWNKLVDKIEAPIERNDTKNNPKEISKP